MLLNDQWVKDIIGKIKIYKNILKWKYSIDKLMENYIKVIKKKVVKSIHIGNDEAKLIIDNIILHIEKPTNYSKFFFLIFINSKWMQ